MERRAQLINSSCYQNPVGGLGRHGNSSPIGFKEADEGMRNEGIRQRQEQDKVDTEGREKKRETKGEMRMSSVTFFSPQPIEKEQRSEEQPVAYRMLPHH